MDQRPAASDRLLGWLCVGVLGLLAVVGALWAVVLLPPLVDVTLLPRIAESLVLAGPAMFFVTLYAGRAAGSRFAALVPAALWLATILLISAGRPEGDNAYLLASYQGLLLAPIGMAAAALGVTRAHRRPWPPADRHQVFEPSADS